MGRVPPCPVNAVQVHAPHFLGAGLKVLEVVSGHRHRDGASKCRHIRGHVRKSANYRGKNPAWGGAKGLHLFHHGAFRPDRRAQQGVDLRSALQVVLGLLSLPNLSWILLLLIAVFSHILGFVEYTI